VLTESSDRPPRGFKVRTVQGAATATGLLLFTLGVLSAYIGPPAWLQGPAAGYDPPFDACAGALLLAVSVRMPGRSQLAWLFSVLAALVSIGIAVLSPNDLSVAGAVASIGLLGVLVASRMRFYRGVPAGGEATQYAVLLAALLSVLYGLVGAHALGDYFGPAPGIHGWDQALYFTISTISTNGSNYEPLTDSTRLFSVTLILLGVGTFLSAIVVFFLPFLERRLERVGRTLERSEMEQLSGHVIICGNSPEAKAVVLALQKRHIPSLLLSADGAVVDLLNQEGYRTYLGDSSTEETLKLVGVDRARSLIAAHPSDADNLLTVITARAILPQLRIVAIASTPASEPKLRRAGANEVVSVVSVAARLVTEAALDGA
jgi:voltage-gated potassium channel